MHSNGSAAQERLERLNGVYDDAANANGIDVRPDVRIEDF
jgi:hypothetical protein